MSETHDDARPVLVVGATGGHGSTGSVVLDALVVGGQAVRALVRADDGRAAELRQRGADTMVGDLHDRASLEAAVDGVRSVYFTYPVAAGVIPAAANLASVLTDTGSRAHVVVMSMVVSALHSPSQLGQAQAVAEEIFSWAGINPTVLRVGGLFHENVLVLHEESIRQKSLLMNNFGDSAAPWISGRDAAELAIGPLLSARPASPQISYPPPAETLSHSQIAAVIGIETGRRIEYRYVEAAQWRRELEALADAAAPGHAMNRAMAQHISALGQAFSIRTESIVSADPGALALLLGHPPMQFTDFVHHNRSRFLPAASPSATEEGTAS